MRWLVVACLSMCAVLSACSQEPGRFVPVPDAVLGPPITTASPDAGPFNGEIAVTLTADRPATIFVSTDGTDPRTSVATRQSGPSPFVVTLTKTTELKYFASERGRDEALHVETWVRAGGPKGTIRGTVVAGNFVANQKVGLFNNGELTTLGTPTDATEYPFAYENVTNGNYRLVAIADRDGDGNLVPLLDYQSDSVTVSIDLADPFKASAEDVRLYLGASGSGLGTLRGTITLPNAPAFQNLQVSVLPADSLGSTLDPMALLQQLQHGYRIFTNQTDSTYPYIINNLKPGSYLPAASLIGFANGGLAINLLANPLKPAAIIADTETSADFAYGPVTVGGAIAIAASSSSAPQGAVSLGMVAARTVSFTQGLQGVLIPVLLTQDAVTKDFRARYAAGSIQANSNVSLRVFTNAGTGNVLTQALLWVVTPLGAAAPHATVSTAGSTSVTADLALP